MSAGPGIPAPHQAPGVFLSAEWRWLAMINFEADPATLLPFVPRGTELDAWNGRTCLSVVGLRFLDTRVCGAADHWSTASYGERFARCLSARPVSAFVAEGSPIVVRRGVRLG